MKRTGASGFTLIELSIVAALVAILSAVVLPMLSDMVAKSQEGSTKGNLGVLRSALSMYYGDTEGVYPVDLSPLVPKYINRIPDAVLPAHSS